MKKTIAFSLSVILIAACLCPLAAGAAASLSQGKDVLYAQWETGDSHGISYKAFSPNVEQGKKYPLVVLLHGKYSGSSNGEQVKNTDFYKWSSGEFQSRFKENGGAYILMPRCPGGDSSSLTAAAFIWAVGARAAQAR